MTQRLVAVLVLVALHDGESAASLVRERVDNYDANVKVTVDAQGVVAREHMVRERVDAYDTKVSMTVDAKGNGARVHGLDPQEMIEASPHHQENEEDEEGEAVGEFEGALDALSWELLAFPSEPGGHPGIQAQDLHTAVIRAAQMYQGTSLDSAAAAGLASWMEAVNRTQSAFDNVNVTKILPPACASEVPASDPYWAQSAHYGHHNVCRFSNNCTKPYTNLERLNSFRKSLRVSKLFMDKFKVQHGLYGGSAIGAYRCQDVLPFDHDTDMFVLQDDVHKLLALLDGKEVTWDSFGKFQRHIDMGAFGSEFEGFILREKMHGCMPFVVVDTSTGFFTDIFPMQIVGSHALVPRVRKAPNAVNCEDAPKLFNGCLIKMCNQWTLENTLPLTSCQIGDVSFNCPAKVHPWLVEQFGSGVTRPKHRVRTE